MVLGPCLLSLYMGRQLISDSKKGRLNRYPSGSCQLCRETSANPPGPDLINGGGPCSPLRGSCIHQSKSLPSPPPHQLFGSFHPLVPPCVFASYAPAQDEWGPAGKDTPSGEREDKTSRRWGADKVTTKSPCSCVWRGLGKWGCTWTTWCDIRNLRGMQIRRRLRPMCFIRAGESRIKALPPSLSLLSTKPSAFTWCPNLLALAKAVIFSKAALLVVYQVFHFFSNQ